MGNTLLLEIFGTLTGLLYVYLEIVQKRSMWIVGGASALTYIIVFVSKGLYAATLLQSYYLVMSIYGWIAWGKENDGRKEKNQPDMVVRKMSPKILLISLISALIVYLVLSRTLIFFTGDPLPKLDSLTAVLSMMATFWVTRRYIENWIIWVAVNGISIYIYATQGLFTTTVLYFAYLAAAVAGYMHWRKFDRIFA